MAPGVSFRSDYEIQVSCLMYDLISRTNESSFELVRGSARKIVIPYCKLFGGRIIIPSTSGDCETSSPTANHECVIGINGYCNTTGWQVGQCLIIGKVEKPYRFIIHCLECAR